MRVEKEKTSKIFFGIFYGIDILEFKKQHAKLLAVMTFGPATIGKNAFAYVNNPSMPYNDIPDASKFVSANNLFSGANAFNGDISKWDVSNVTDMSGMFLNASVFNGDISEWDVSGVENMSEMFANATAFNQDLSQWNVKQVKNMKAIFFGAAAFNQDLSVWDFSSLKAHGGSWILNLVANSAMSRQNVCKLANRIKTQKLGGKDLNWIIRYTLGKNVQCE